MVQKAHDNVPILAHFSLWLCLCCSFLDAYRLRTVDLFWDAAGEGCKVQLKEAIEKFEDKLLEQLQAQMKALETALGSGVLDTLQEGLKNKEDLKNQYLQMQEEVLVSGVLPPKKDIQKHEIERLLRKFGFSVEDVVVAVVGASLERNERFGGCRQSLWVTRHRH